MTNNKEHTIDIAPAISELKRLHLALVDRAATAAAGVASGLENPYADSQARDTVISIVPKERRIELGWYKVRTWERKSEAIREELDPGFHRKKYHEIFVAGEALAGNAEDLVYLMMHQVTHQAASVPSIRAYHGEWYRHWSGRLWGIPHEAWSRVPQQGWVELDKKHVPERTRTFVKKLAGSIDLGNIDMFRELAPPAKSGRMFLWVCACGKPKIRTGGRPRYTCDLCGQKVKFVKEVNTNVEAKFLDKIGPEFIQEAVDV